MSMELMVAARRQGVLVYVAAGQLKARAIGGALTPALREAIGAAKAMLLETLPQTQPDWLDDAELQAQEAFWREHLADAPRMHALPLDRPRPAADRRETSAAASTAVSTMTDLADAPLLAALDRLAVQWGVERHVLLHAAFAALLQRWSDATPVLVGGGLPVSAQPAERLRGETLRETMPVLLEIDPQAPFARLAQDCREALHAAHRHADLPLALIQDLLELERAGEAPALPQLLFLPEDFDDGLLPVRFDLAFAPRAVDDGLRLEVRYDATVFDAATPVALAQAYATLLAALVRAPDAAVGALDPLAAADAGRQLEWNATAVAFDRELCLHTLIARHAAATPDAIAVRSDTHALSYRELQALADRFAARLSAQGVGPGSVVAVCGPRTPELMAGFLGVLIAGGAYLPIDPAMPQARIAHILQDSGARALLTTSALASRWDDTGLPRILLDADDDTQPVAPPAPEHAATADDLAYLIYTSGSTGTPKGVALEHRGAVNLLANQQALFGVDRDSRVLQFASIGFDAATWEWIMALGAGATLCLCPDDIRASAEDLAEYLVARRITHATLPPALVAHMDPRRDYALRALVVAGEACPDVVRDVWAAAWPLYNAYGPSETTVCATVERLRPGEAITIGRPLRNLQVWVLDVRGRPLPAGAIGELAIGGVALARGYVGKPALTAQRFIDAELPDGRRSRLYRTGDRARLLADGRVQFLGRIDDQIKLRGLRIELGEIEAVLQAQPEVAQAVVAVRAGERGASLAAYAVPAATVAAEARDALAPTLLARLRERLPDYMVPASLLPVEAFPLNRNGKIDKPALLALDAAGAVEKDDAPRTEVERVLTALWAELLQLPRVGIHDNFFAIGGDSILSIQAVARANQAGIAMTTRQIHEHLTIAALAAQCAPTLSTDDAAEVVGESPLLPIQRRYLESRNEDLHHFNQAVLLVAPPALEADRLRATAGALVDRHAALRLVFVRDDANGGHRAHHPGREDFPLDEAVATETHDPAAEDFETFLARVCDAHQRRFDLARGPLIRLVLLRGEAQARLLIVAHHLVVDGVSWRLLLQDLEQAWANVAAGAPIALPPPGTSFQQWAQALAAHARSPQLEAELPYWLAQSQPQPLPAALAPDREPAQTPLQASTRQCEFELDEAETAQLLRESIQPYRNGVDELLLAALGLALRALGGGDTLWVALEGHGREPIGDAPDAGQTIGWFTSLFPFRVALGDGDTGRALRAVKDARRRVPHGGLGYGLLRHAVAHPALTASETMPQVLFNYLGQFDVAVSGQSAFALAAEGVGRTVSERQRREFALGFNALVSGRRLRVAIDYSADAYDAATVGRLVEAFDRALRAVLAHCLQAAPRLSGADLPLADVDLAELDALQAEYDIARLYPATAMQRGLLFHTLMDGQAYTSQIALTLEGPLDAERLHQAWQAVVDRHDVFRTAIVDAGTRPHQLVVRTATLPWEEIDLRALPEAGREAAYTRRQQALRREGFDLRRPPLMHLALFRLADDRHRLLWSHHHALLDGWSLPRVYQEVMGHYQAALAGAALPALPAPHPYEDYVAWLESRDANAARAYWNARLGDVEAPTPLSVDKLPAAREGRHRFAECTLDPDATARLLALARRSRTTLYTVLQFAWAWLLHKYSGEDSVVFGAIASGRPPELPGVEGMVGLFINTLPVRVRIDPKQDIPTALARIHRDFQDSTEAGHLPLPEIARQSGMPAGVGLFDTLMVLENYPLDQAIGADTAEGLRLSAVDAFEETHYTLTVNANLSDRLHFRCSFRTDVVAETVVERLLGHLLCLLRQLPAQDDPAALELLTAAEQSQLAAWHVAEASAPTQCLHHWFERQVAATPDAIALRCDEDSLSYAGLNARANRLAHVLRARGVGPESLVGLCVERGIPMLVGVLGILKAGAAYVPFDPSTPAARLAYLVEDSGVAAVVGERATAELLPQNAVQVLLDDPALDAAPDTDPDHDAVAVRPEHAAYVIYTSGSTGKPKGVVVEHRHVSRLMTVSERHFGFDAQDVWTLFHSYAFDFSVWEMWGALLYGGTLVIVPKEVARSPERFHRLVADRGVTVLNQTPGAFEQFRKVDAASNETLRLRYVIFGGAALDYHSLLPWMQRHPQGPRMINMYGITETTVHVTFREVTHADVLAGRGSLIGPPLADLSLLVLDPAQRPVPIGVTGELYVGGAGVSRGYLHRPELTAQRFLSLPGLTGMFYRTGDLARRHEDGELEYVGRIDNQVKIRGFRIELGEIEAELHRQPHVREALVLAPGEGAERRLVAYAVLDETAPDAGDARRAAQALREGLARTLPEHMVPSLILVIPVFPLNINGKIDRARLPKPETAIVADAEARPLTPAQARMAEVWCSVLELPAIGADDNFFAVGGDSIRAIPLVSRLKTAGFVLGIKDLFEAPTIAQLTARCEDRVDGSGAVAALAPFALLDEAMRAALASGISTGELADAYPMTALQQGMVFHNLLSHDHATYHDVMSFHVRLAWDAARFGKALAALTAQHELLRTVFSLEGQTPLQCVLARHAPEVVEIDLTALDPAARAEAIAQAVADERRFVFDPTRPPWRVLVHRRGADEFQYTLSFHHAIMDGWSVANFNTQLFNAYLGRSAPAGAPPLPFAHYVRLELDAVRDPAVRAAWREKVDGAALPWWAGRPKRRTLTGMQRLAATTSQGLAALAQRLGVQERSVLLAAHVALMALLDGGRDVVTSVVTNGRPEQEGGDRTLGLFLNSLPFRLRLEDDNWAQLVRRVDREVAAYYAIRHLPLSEIQSECGLDFSASLFNYTNFHVYQSLDEGLEVLGAQGAEEKNYAISLSISKAIGTDGPQFDVSIDVDADLFPEPFFRRIEGYLRAIVEAIAGDPDAPVALDALLGEEERERQLRTWNDTAAPFDDVALHRAFEAQARRTPDAPAVRCGAEVLDYATLNRRANQLAHALRAHGVVAGDRVGLCVTNGVGMLAGMLGALKAGAAYVPLDPAHPRSRIRQVVEDAGIAVVLTLRALAPSLAEAGAQRLVLDDADALALVPETNLDREADTRAAAYVIYTSGSTGRPKGVVVSHRALTMYLAHAQATYYAPPPQGSLVATSYAFDLTKPALYLPLLAGGEVELLDAVDPLGDLVRRIDDPACGDRLVRATPMHVQAMLDLLPDAPCPARHVFVIGGEAFPPALAQRLRQRFPQARVYNHYGPSEAVVGCTMLALDDRTELADDTLPIGRPMANTALYVLDERLQPCPIGVPGILHVAGEGLADGYLGQPELTAASFPQNPFVPGTRMYRTGDRVRYLEDGRLLFLGRADDQLKLRGFRVELGEIEAALRAQPFVREAAVVARGAGADQALVAYVVARADAGVDLAEAVRTALRARLPEYMVPAAVVALDALPLSGNGKIDRRRLPEPDWGAARRFVAPEGETEQRLARLWSELLDAAEIGATDNFFERGGHSLKATRLVSAIQREFAVQLPLLHVFQAQDLRALATRIDEQTAAARTLQAAEAAQMTEMEW
jgi:amino acid adenylation domain-containing protein/non-ribosomal peptide synthase protein (TIGR01720 family)